MHAAAARYAARPTLVSAGPTGAASLFDDPDHIDDPASPDSLDDHNGGDPR